MNTRFLHALCLVAEHGSIAAAARQLGLAHATLAEQIRALETELDVKLIKRRGHGMVLTPAGETVLPAARDILAQLRNLRHLAHGGSPRGRLRVGAISTALMALMPSALQTLATHFPGIEISVVPGTSAGLLRMLQADEIDCALIVEPPFPVPKSLTWRAVRQEKLALFATHSSDSADIDTVLASTPFIRMDRRSWTGRLVEAFLISRGVTITELFELDAPETIAVLVSKGMGSALLPNWGASAEALGAIRITEIADERYARTVGILSRNGPVEGLVIRFVDAIRTDAG